MKIQYEPRYIHGRLFIDLKPEYVEVILETLSNGWKLALASSTYSLTPDICEVKINECLREGMRRVVNKKQPSPKRLRMRVERGMESVSTPSVMTPDGLTDIPLTLLGDPLLEAEHDPHVIIECKRIEESDSRLCRDYVNEGMDRFIKGKYGENHAIGFMVGYVLSGLPSGSVSKINSYLKNQSRSKDSLKSSSSNTNSTWYSRHSRPKPPKSLCLYHAFLVF